jgi:competence protein ComFC
MNILDFFFPKRCLGCGKIGRYFCLNCQTKIRFVALHESICPMCEKQAIDGATHPVCKMRYSLDGLTSFFHYEKIIQRAIKSIKYRYVSDIAKEFVDLVPQGFLRDSVGIKGTCVVVPIPLHPSRQKERGFNQAEIMGRMVAKRLQIPLVVGILKRQKKTVPQVEMRDKKQRLKNMDGVFVVEDNNKLPESVLLFDDVFTTGATMRAAANVLKRAGVRFVRGITMSR